MKFLLWIVVTVGLHVCERSATARAHAVTGERCAMPAGWSEITQQHPRFVIFGEIHGTREAPAFVGDVACSLAEQGKHVLVAVEHGVTNDAAFQAAWRLPHPAFRAAITNTGWSGRRDGVASTAMLQLLVRLHRRKGAGGSIAITAFNGTRDDDQRRRFAGLPGQEPHEAAQAENIRRAANARHFDHVLVLVGNLHARKKPIGEGAGAFRPMAMQLASTDETVSLNMMTAGGTMWNCILRPDAQIAAVGPITEKAIECGDHPTVGRADLGASAFMALGTPEQLDGDGGYDGVFWLGRVTSSGPAVLPP